MKNAVSSKELAKRFALVTYAQYNDQVTMERITMERTAEEFYALARWLNIAIPEGRDKALALTRLEESLMWAHSAILMNVLNKREDSNV